MTAQFIGARVPICDKDFVVNPIWYRLFSALFDTSGVGSVSDDNESSVAPVGVDNAVILSALAQDVDNITPVTMVFSAISDDVSPAFALLQSEIAELRTQIDDLRKGLAA